MKTWTKSSEKQWKAMNTWTTLWNNKEKQWKQTKTSEKQINAMKTYKNLSKQRTAMRTNKKMIITEKNKNLKKTKKAMLSIKLNIDFHKLSLHSRNSQKRYARATLRDNQKASITKLHCKHLHIVWLWGAFWGMFTDLLSIWLEVVWHFTTSSNKSKSIKHLKPWTPWRLNTKPVIFIGVRWCALVYQNRFSYVRPCSNNLIIRLNWIHCLISSSFF